MNQMKELHFSAGLWVYGQVPDRYLPIGYKNLDSLEERLSCLKNTVGVEGVELPFGPVLREDNFDEVNALLKHVDVKATSLTANVVGDRKYGKGSISSPDFAVREESKLFVKQSMQAAKKLGVEVVNLWMGQEGFDYIFESDYHRLWTLISEGIDECAKSCPEVKLSIEYKRMEPRARNIPNSAAQALLLALEGNNPNVGVTIDFGHAIMGGENASQSAVMLSDYKKLFNIHINDNYADWDWDMIAGVDHWWQLVEFCFYLQRIDFNGNIVLDIFPYRQNAIKASELSIKAFEKAWDIASSLDKEFISDEMAKQNAMGVFETLFNL